MSASINISVSVATHKAEVEEAVSIDKTVISNLRQTGTSLALEQTRARAPQRFASFCFNLFFFALISLCFVLFTHLRQSHSHSSNSEPNACPQCNPYAFLRGKVKLALSQTPRSFRACKSAAGNWSICASAMEFRCRWRCRLRRWKHCQGAPLQHLDLDDDHSEYECCRSVDGGV